MITSQERDQLMAAAKSVLDKAYVPYSHFPVGAALLMDDGQIITGVNVENVSFGATNCAERTAVFTSVTQGYAPKSIQAVAVAGITESYLTPCSICRQVLVEMCAPDTPVFLTRKDGDIFETSVQALVPYAFDHMDV